MTDFKWRHFERNIILWAVQRYCRGDISYRDLAWTMRRRGIIVDHSTLCRWTRKYAPTFERPACSPAPDVQDWSVEEHTVRLGRRRKYLYRAVDRSGNTVDFVLSGIQRGKSAARRRIGKALGEKPGTGRRRGGDAVESRPATAPVRTQSGTGAIAPVPFKPARAPERNHPPDHQAGNPENRPASLVPIPPADPETSCPPCAGAWLASPARAVRLARTGHPGLLKMAMAAVVRERGRLSSKPYGYGRMAAMVEKTVSA